MIDEGYDLVNATRLARRPKAMPFANYLANRIFAWTARLFHGIRTTDVHSGMRAYRKSMIELYGAEVFPSPSARTCRSRSPPTPSCPAPSSPSRRRHRR